jgi:hypothetical protein
MVRSDQRQPIDFALQEPLLLDGDTAHLDELDNPTDGDEVVPSPSRFRLLIEQPPANFVTRFRQRMHAQNQVAADDRSSLESATRDGWTSIFTNPSMTEVILLALYLSQVFLIWISLSSPAWMELRIRLPFHADLPIESFGLAQLLQQLYNAEFGVPTTILWIVSLVVPSLFTIFAPSFFLNIKSSRKSAGRVVVESLQHAPFAAIYVMNLVAALHDVGSSDDASLYVHAKPPISAFAFGIMSSMTFVSILRIRQGIPKAAEARNDMPEDTEDDEYVPMRILEDTPPIPPPNESSQASPRVAFWKKFVVLQLGLLSLLFWAPAFFFPYCTLKVDSGLIRVLEHDIRLGSIIFSLPASMMFVPIILAPLAATGVSFAAWMGDQRFKVLVYALRPWMGSINLGLTACLSLPLMPRIMIVPTLSLHVQASWGLYICLMQAVCTELMVIATLCWLP